MALSIRIDQCLKQPVYAQEGDRISFRFAYERSSDSIKTNSPGQDYLAINFDNNKIGFVLCDGVSQSFYGDLAARYLGDGLVDWLWDFHGQAKPDSAISIGLPVFLDELSEKTRQRIAEFQLPSDLPPMLTSVLEKKRSLGSETIFTAGYVDLNIKIIVLVWMGDSRLRVWGKKQECTAEKLGLESFQTRERWSTHRGKIGELHTAILSTEEIDRVVSYSDGLSRLDRRMRTSSPSNFSLQSIIDDNQQLPTSDDISFIEISMGGPQNWERKIQAPPEKVSVRHEEQKRELKASWRENPAAQAYEVAFQSRNGWKIFDTEQPFFVTSFDMLPVNSAAIAVRAWIDGDLTAWSSPKQLKIPQITQLTPQIRMSSLPPNSANTLPQPGMNGAVGFPKVVERKGERKWELFFILAAIPLVLLGWIIFNTIVSSAPMPRGVVVHATTSTSMLKAVSGQFHALFPETEDAEIFHNPDQWLNPTENMEIR